MPENVEDDFVRTADEVCTKTRMLAEFANKVAWLLDQVRFLADEDNDLYWLLGRIGDDLAGEATEATRAANRLRDHVNRCPAALGGKEE